MEHDVVESVTHRPLLECDSLHWGVETGELVPTKQSRKRHGPESVLAGISSTACRSRRNGSLGHTNYL
jgi:hypothetical protein